LDERARGFDLRLDPLGLAPEKDGRHQPVTSEADLYGQLELPYLPPEVREDDVDLTVAADRCSGGLVQESDTFRVYCQPNLAGNSIFLWDTHMGFSL
jgi:hypothetical protein